MKPMKDRSMDMNGGPVDSDGYFPSEAKHKKMPRAGEIGGPKYPDTEEAVHDDSESQVKAIKRNMPKKDFRH
jgi:hypothetical protein